MRQPPQPIDEDGGCPCPVTAPDLTVDGDSFLLLDGAGHGGPRRVSRDREHRGTEWFLTSTEFLHATAITLNLEIVELDAPDESS